MAEHLLLVGGLGMRDPMDEFMRMIDEDIPCEDVLAQINAAKSALHKAGQVILEGHIQHCVLEGLQNGNVDETIAKFTKTIERFANMG